MILLIILINTVMKHLVKLFEKTKKLNIDLTRYEFSTDFLNKKKSSYCVRFIAIRSAFFGLWFL